VSNNANLFRTEDFQGSHNDSRAKRKKKRIRIRDSDVARHARRTCTLAVRAAHLGDGISAIRGHPLNSLKRRKRDSDPPTKQGEGRALGRVSPAAFYQKNVEGGGKSVESAPPKREKDLIGSRM